MVLLSFGADGYLEVLAAGAVLWRLSYRDEKEANASQRAIGFIGVTFLILGATIVLQAALSITNRQALGRLDEEESPPTFRNERCPGRARRRATGRPGAGRCESR